MAKLLQIAAIAVTLIYPFGVYFGLQYFNPRTLVLLLIVIFGIRSFTLQKSPINHWLWLPLLGVLVAWTWLADSDTGLKFYPVMVNLSLLLLFGYSLISPPSMVERFARLRRAQLTEQGVDYTRVVTLIWTLLFLFNATVAAATALWASDAVWALYNGFIAYLLAGLLFAGEWLVRRRLTHLHHD